jgi:type I restriction enzyme S subunit
MTTERRLPEGWRLLRFAEIAENIIERVDDPSSSGLDHYIGLEHLDPDTLKISRWGSPTDVEATKLRFYPGDVIYARRRAYQRKLGVAEWDGIASAHSLVLRARPDVCLPTFLPYFLQSDQFHQRALDISVGSLSPTINWKTLAAQQFALPPVEQQERIVDVLAGAWRVRETYLLSTDCAAAALDAVRRELLAEDRTGDLRPLGDVIDLAMGRVYPSEDYGAWGVLLLRPGNIAPTGRLEWVPSATVRLPERYTTDRNVVMLSPGDVVMNLTAQSMEDGFLGRVCLASEGDESIVNQRIGRIRSSLLPNEYIFRVLQDQSFRRHVESIAKGSKIKHLYWQDLARFEIPCPPEARVLEVVERTRAAEGVIAAAVRAAKSASVAAKTLAESLLVGDA